MSSNYRLTPRAISDLYNIWLYIAADSIQAADRVEAEILAACERLARFPLLGSLQTGLKKRNIRILTVARFSNYRIVYYPETKPLRVAAILHGRRNIRKVLTSRGYF
jgi:plasmid stabilization system protein ParE